MDQLKDALAVLKKYHFWILCALIMIAYLGMWFLAISDMTRETEVRVSTIENSYSATKRISGVTNHPNTDSVAMMKLLNQAEADEVRVAWQSRFNDQKDVLVWPTELEDDFIAAVEGLIPIELKVDFPTPPEKELKLDYRLRYRDYIREEMPKLAEIIGAKWHISSTATSSGVGGYPGMGGGMGMGMGSGMGSGMGPGMGYGESGEDEYEDYGDPGGSGYSGSGYYGAGQKKVEEDPIVVEWSQQNQAQLQASSFPWVRPNTLQVLYAQENLWILNSLMLMIKETNGDAEAQYNAAIKEIMAINIGRLAVGIKSAGRVSQGQAVGGAGSGDYYEMMTEGDGEMDGGEMGSYSDAGDGSLGSGSGSTPAAIDPADNRYVDDNMEPLTGDSLRTAMQSATADNAFLVVAKRMPVRLRLKMDVLKLPLLLCNCANSNLPVEVRQVRINPPTAGGLSGGYGGYGESGGSAAGPASAGAGAGGGSMGIGFAPDGGYGEGYGEGYEEGEDYGEGYSEGGYPGSGSSYGMGKTIESPYDATVEIYGLIYIYNPVDASKLVDESTDETSAGTDTGTATDAGSGTDPDSGTVAAADSTDADTGTDADTSTTEPETTPGTESPKTGTETNDSTNPGASTGAAGSSTDTTPAIPGNSGAGAADTTGAGAGPAGNSP